MSEGKYDLPLPDGMPPETLTKRFFAKMYGFTEEMTDDASLDAVTWWPTIEQAQNDAEIKKSKQAQRQSR
jgi:hypothetical protein